MNTQQLSENVELLKANLVAPYELKRKYKIEVATSLAEARRLVKRGYCPIECSSGAESVVDDLRLDHHGELRDLEGVAIRAYRDFFGARVHDPRLVFFGFPDEDATFAGLSVLGLLPHPMLADVFKDLPEVRHLRVTQNLMHLAELINAVDIDPDQGKHLDNTSVGRMMITWRQLGHPSRQDWLAWVGAMDRWRTLLDRDPRKVEDVGVELQEDMLERVLGIQPVTYGTNSEVAVADFTDFGRNSHLYEHWTTNKTPVLLAYFADTCAVSIAVRDIEWAKEHIGPDGLMHLYPRLERPGAGGREVLGGLSRFHRFTWEEAKEAGEQLAELLRQIRDGELNFNKPKRKSRRRRSTEKK